MKLREMQISLDADYGEQSFLGVDGYKGTRNRKVGVGGEGTGFNGIRRVVL